MLRTAVSESDDLYLKYVNLRFVQPLPSSSSVANSAPSVLHFINAGRMREGYCSLSVGLFVCVFVADLVPAYDACATN